MCGALVGKSNMLLLVTSFMAGPWIINLLICYALLRRIDLKRNFPKRVTAGDPFSVEIVIVNTKRFLSSWVLKVSDQLNHMHERLTPRVVFTRVPPQSDCSVHYQARLMHRGRYRLGPLQVSSQFPLGLVERALVIQEKGEILVYPQMGELSVRWRNQTSSAHELVQHAPVRPGSFDDEFHRLREYRFGDDPRAIHWRTSARQNELMVREYHQSREDDLTVLLDLWIPSQPTSEDYIRAEFAVSFAATIGFDHCDNARGTTLGLSILGQKTDHWQGLAGPYGIDPYLELLALTEPDACDNLASFVDEAAIQQGENGRCLLITTRPGMPPPRSRNGNGEMQIENPAHDEYSGAFRTIQELPETATTIRQKSKLEIWEADPKKLAGLFQLHAALR